MSLRFGTDGIRGAANTQLTPDLALAVGRAAARVLGPGPWVVGRDTRISGPLIHAAFAAGLASEGATSIDVGVIPTPGVAHLAELDVLPGAVISASHNPYVDNGIKLFGPGGLKLDDAAQTSVEAELEAIEAAGIPGSADRPAGDQVGRLLSAPESIDRYSAHLQDEVLEGRRLSGLKVVVDCAHGAASAIAPRVLAMLGASVTVIHADPDGTNINLGCGATDPGVMQAAVLARGADIGLAFDGDADRVVAADAKGNLVDGDQIIAALALDLRDRGLLTDDTVVVTVMSNLGFRQAMAAEGITVVDTAVGDRHVLAELERGGFAIGGEQSGHIILRDLATTGDGMLAGISLLDVIARTERPLLDLVSVMTPLPQVLTNVKVAGDAKALVAGLTPEIAAAEASLGDRGRILVRPSGTEPLVRVMVEAPTEDEAAAVAATLAAALPT